MKLMGMGPPGHTWWERAVLRGGNISSPNPQQHKKGQRDIAAASHGFDPVKFCSRRRNTARCPQAGDRDTYTHRKSFKGEEH